MGDRLQKILAGIAIGGAAIVSALAAWEVPSRSERCRRLESEIDGQHDGLRSLQARLQGQEAEIARLRGAIQAEAAVAPAPASEEPRHSPTPDEFRSSVRKE